MKRTIQLIDSKEQYFLGGIANNYKNNGCYSYFDGFDYSKKILVRFEN